MKTKVVFYGASVTAQSKNQSGIQAGYFDHVKEKLESRHSVEVVRRAWVGGFLSNSGFAGLIDIEEYLNSETIVLLECFSTSEIEFDTDRLHTIYEYLLYKGCTIVNLVLPVLPAATEMQKPCIQQARHYHFQFDQIHQINLYKHIFDFNELIRDTQHTTPEGGIKYAEVITQEIERRFFNPARRVKEFDHGATRCKTAKKYGNFPASKLNIAEHLNPNDEITIDIANISGPISIYAQVVKGPFSPSVKIKFDEIEYTTITWNEWCFYTHPWDSLIAITENRSVPITCSKIQLSISGLPPDYNKITRDPKALSAMLTHNGELSLKISGAIYAINCTLISASLKKFNPTTATQNITRKMEPTFSNSVFNRGFIISNENQSTLEQHTAATQKETKLGQYKKTYFGPCVLWHDPLLNYNTTRNDKYGVGVLGLCINPFDDSIDNKSISENLFNCLSNSRESFYEYLDQLSGSFIIIFRENAKVYLLQDAAATKSTYFHITSEGKVTAASHINLVANAHKLMPNTSAELVWNNVDYKKDPSRYLPGLITPIVGVSSLTANSELCFDERKTQRFFPRENLPTTQVHEQLVNQIAMIMRRQAELLGNLERPLYLAATGGKDSRTSAAAFSGQKNLRYFSFHFSKTGHLSEDIRIAKMLATADNVPIDIFDLDNYRTSEFNTSFQKHSPKGIWPSAALCYLSEFEPDAIHIRSTVSEIGRAFYGRRSEKVDAVSLAKTYTSTPFHHDPLVIEAMREYIDKTQFLPSLFYNYDPFDLFYWEHRNSKWQNVLCSEAEMATDVFIPFNNRCLLKLFLSVPLKDRQNATLHQRVWKILKPEFTFIEIAS